MNKCLEKTNNIGYVCKDANCCALYNLSYIEKGFTSLYIYTMYVLTFLIQKEKWINFSIHKFINKQAII